MNMNATWWNGSTHNLLVNGYQVVNGPITTTTTNVPMLRVDMDAFTRSVEKTQEQLDELMREKVRREMPPFHWWAPDLSGRVCRICDFDNIYRDVPDAHTPVIQEAPEQEDWQRKLDE